MIEVGEWGDMADIGFVAFYGHGEPESEFTEPDCHGVAVDAEDGGCEQCSSPFVRAALIACLFEQCVEQFQCPDQECA